MGRNSAMSRGRQCRRVFAHVTLAVLAAQMLGALLGEGLADDGMMATFAMPSGMANSPMQAALVADDAYLTQHTHTSALYDCLELAGESRKWDETVPCLGVVSAAASSHTSPWLCLQ